MRSCRSGWRGHATPRDVPRGSPRGGDCCSSRLDRPRAHLFAWVVSRVAHPCSRCARGKRQRQSPGPRRSILAVRQAVEQARSHGQRVGSSRGEREGDHADLGRLAATRSAGRLAQIPPLAVGRPFCAPAASWWARTLAPSTKVMPGATPRGCTSSGRRSHTPCLDQRMNSCAASHQGPNSAGMLRRLDPFWRRQNTAGIVRRSSSAAVVPRGRTSSINRSHTAQTASVKIRLPLPCAMPAA